MNRGLSFLIAIVILVAFGWFCIYAHGIVDVSKADSLKGQLNDANTNAVANQKALEERVKAEIAKQQKAKELLLALLPNKAEDITNIFNSVNEPKKEEPKPDAKAPAPVATTSAATTDAAPAASAAGSEKKKDGETR